MKTIDEFLDYVMDLALEILKYQPIPIYTFAFYHDHESRAVSICVDTKSSSDESVLSSNQWSMKYFDKHIKSGELSDAKLFQANLGRSLSLGDFAEVNLAYTDIPKKFKLNEEFYLAMIRCVIKHQDVILSHSEDPDQVVFSSSTKDDEAGLVWSRLIHN